MSMLAEPKRKQKWSLNPRGKQWSEDSNKFGQKMLEKMGWSSGKGLGAKEQGPVEPIRVKLKNDQVGIGFDKNRDDHWTEHQDDFNSLLQNLQKEQAGVPVEIPQEKEKVLSGKSLEERSKLSQKRVHYKKFTRGKDVNKYSTKDLANIFGKKDLHEKTIKEKKQDDDNDEKIFDPIGTQDHTAGILTMKGGNMYDYFKKKLNHVENYNIINEKENSESEGEQDLGIEDSAKSKSTFYINDENARENEDFEDKNSKYLGFGFVKSSESKSKNKKHINLNYVFDNPCLDLNILDNDSPVPRKIKTEIVDLEYNETVTPRKRKCEYSYDNIGLDLECADRPTPKKIKIEPVLNGYENPALDLDCSDKSILQNVDKIKVESVENVYENPVSDMECLDKLKCKKSIIIESKIHGIENPALDLEFPDRPTPKTNRNTKFESEINGIENPGLDLEYSDRPTPKKSKKVKVVSVVNVTENSKLDLQFSDKQSSRKPIKIKDVEIIGMNGIENPALDLEFSDRLTPKKSKKGKEIEVLSTAFENPALNLDNHSNEVCNMTDFEVSRASYGLENNALDVSDENSNKKRVTFNDQVEYNTDTIKKKKKRKLDKYEVENEKPKKKGKSRTEESREPTTFVNEGLDIEFINSEELDNEINEIKSEKGKRKRRKPRMIQLETIQEIPEEENSNEASKHAENSIESSDKGVENVNEFMNKDVQEVAHVSLSKKKKKKKSKKKIPEEIDISQENEIEDDVSELSNEIGEKKKKKNVTKATIEEIVIDDRADVREKKNICCEKDEKTNYDSKKVKKKKSDDDVVSLEEFLNEECTEKKVAFINQGADFAISRTKDTDVAVEDNNLSSFQKFKKSKQLMKSLFLKNPTLTFNGSNINEIKGYGSNVQNNNY